MQRPPHYAAAAALILQQRVQGFCAATVFSIQDLFIYLLEADSWDDFREGLALGFHFIFYSTFYQTL